MVLGQDEQQQLQQQQQHTSYQIITAATTEDDQENDIGIENRAVEAQFQQVSVGRENGLSY